MKTKILLLIIIAITFCGCPEGRYTWYFDNQTNDTLGVYFALGHDGQTAYPDTTLPVDPNKAPIMGADPHKKQSLLVYDPRPYEDVIKSLPKDTLSIFIINIDSVGKFTWEEIRQGYKILRRYDLSLSDIRCLYMNSCPVIPYPPDERMKDMKMYPPYGSE